MTGSLDHCMNCDEPLAANASYCHVCGQVKGSRMVPFRALMQDLLTDVFAFDSKIANTIPKLVLSPGALTNEFIRGRRARYVPPVRVYLFISLVAFFLMSLRPESADLDQGAISVNEAGKEVLHLGGVNVTVTDAEEARIDIAKEGVGPWLERISKDKSWFERQVSKMLALAVTKDLNEVEHNFERALPLVSILVIPVLAWVMLLFFPGMLYVAHLIFMFHVAAFTFLLNIITTSVELVARVDVAWLLVVGILIYLPIAISRVYHPGVWRQIFSTFTALLVMLLFTSLLMLSFMTLAIYMA